ncbi:MAG: FecR domain-containing protein [Novosphingobium sp.]|jgi:transmembrane sensor|nr:FecR domain-containing protein [Novosphingobium sp.]
MNRELEQISAEAAAWLVASDNDDMDWDGLTLWLEADPRHAAAYDELMLTSEVVRAHEQALQAACRETVLDTPRRPGLHGMAWKRWAGMAIAASFALVFAVPHFLPAPAKTYRAEAGATRVALIDGSTIMLAPHSSLTVSGDRQEKIALSGGAWFDIRHDPARSLSIRAGGVEISDIGTRFDVQTGDRQVRVAVAEGEVKVSAAALDVPLRLSQGRGLVFDEQERTAIVQDVAREAIGLWRTGRLSYRDTRLSLVAADISRYAGVRVEVAPSLRHREFSGTLVTGNGEVALRDLSQLMGLELAGGRGSYRLREWQRAGS